MSGKIERIENFLSEYVTPRNVDIWLPEGYSDTTQYAVLYMHDGQMLFDSSQTWNRQSWDADDVVSKLMSRKELLDFIIVGIWNGGQTRHSDYFPQKPFEQLSSSEKDTIISQLIISGRAIDKFVPQSDNYLKFLVTELKPYIDEIYSVKTDRENTFIAGSSMGGLISMYALCEYPEVFGGAVCMSTHWPGIFKLENNPMPNAFINYLNRNLPNPKTHKLYFDYGDQTLDALYPGIQKEVDQVMINRGYSEVNWMTKYFPGDDHSEISWNKRLSFPLLFLLGK
ncbi:MAG TPA: alpha/beta hydrolase-fold protein [Saprospiraceae bacterium]|nr:alpha/beta hydrolase-fold protein [Saprospiraceae bacterium]